MISGVPAAARTMDYLSALHLDRDPFPETPDPDLFFPLPDHRACLQRIELSLRLCRGLNVVIGEPGMGKTTLCRELLRTLEADKVMEPHLLAATRFPDPSTLLQAVSTLLHGETPPAGASDWQLKESIKKTLFRRNVDERRIVVLLIDDGQRLPTFAIEILREFLNYETNQYKLLQIVIFAAPAFQATLKHHPNFADRINFHHVFRPLRLSETHSLVRFRLEAASSGTLGHAFFGKGALWAIHRHSHGNPNKISTLCRLILLLLVVEGREQAGRSMVEACARKAFSRPGPFPSGPRLLRRLFLVTTAILLFLALKGSLP